MAVIAGACLGGCGSGSSSTGSGTLGVRVQFHVGNAVRGAPNAADPTFVRDQAGLYDPAQFANTAYYPTGYHWRIDPAITAANIVSAIAQYETTQQNWAVLITFDTVGASRFRADAGAAFAAGVGSPLDRIAVFLGPEVLTAPTVVSPPSSPSTEFTGNFTEQGARSIAAQLTGGS